MNKKRTISVIILLGILFTQFSGFSVSAGGYTGGIYSSRYAIIGTVSGIGIIREDNVLCTWGRDFSGCLGNDRKTYTQDVPTPILADVVFVGDQCAIKSDGSLWTWGDNTYGRLGTGGPEAQYTPVKVMDDVIFAAANYERTFAIKSDNTLWAAGNPAFFRSLFGSSPTVWGALADDKTRARPVFQKVADDVAFVSLSEEHCAYIKTDGSLWVWGINENGRIGDGTHKSLNLYADGTILKPIHIMDSVSYVDCSPNATLAIKEDGSLWTWGSNTHGMLGQGTEDAFNPTPTKIMDQVVAASIDNGTGAAVKKDGSLWTWGKNRYGQLCLDIYEVEMLSAPTKVLDYVADVYVRNGATYVVKEDGSVWIYGKDARSLSIGDYFNKNPFKLMDGTFVREEADFHFLPESGTIKEYIGLYGGDMIIPQKIGGVPVTVIGEDAFRDCMGLTSVKIQDGVTEIGYSAFVNCKNPMSST